MTLAVEVLEERAKVLGDTIRGLIQDFTQETNAVISVNVNPRKVGEVGGKVRFVYDMDIRFGGDV